MGCQQSTPGPAEKDDLLLYEHGPPLKRPLSSMLPPKHKGETYEFDMKTNVWDNESTIHVLGLLFRPIDNQYCALLQSRTEELLVVLKVVPAGKIHICSVTPATRNTASCGTYQGRALYKWATVTKCRAINQFQMTTTKADGRARYKSVSGKRKIVLKRKGRPCASMDKSGYDAYKCRISPGIDPVLVVSYVASLDKITDRDMKTGPAGYTIAY